MINNTKLCVINVCHFYFWKLCFRQNTSRRCVLIFFRFILTFRSPFIVEFQVVIIKVLSHLICSAFGIYQFCYSSFMIVTWHFNRFLSRVFQTGFSVNVVVGLVAIHTAFNIFQIAILLLLLLLLYIWMSNSLYPEFVLFKLAPKLTWACLPASANQCVCV